jgi:hypothetical protein
MAPVVDVAGVTAFLQQRKIAPVLGLPVAVVADVIEDQFGPVADRSAVLNRHHLDGVDHTLVHHAAEADARIVAPQPVLEVGRGVSERPQQDAQRDLGRRPQTFHQALARDWLNALVGIQVQHPLSADVLESQVPRLRGGW